MYPKISKLLLGSLMLVVLINCKQKEVVVVKEPWIDKPVAEWPTFAMVNEVKFRDTLFNHLGNAFLLDTGKDTLAVTCKHVFLAFEKRVGAKTIDLGPDFLSWHCYPLNNTDQKLVIGDLINKDTNESVVPFRQMKIKDWLLLTIKEADPTLYPLKLRTTPVMKHEVVYAVGWGSEQNSLDLPEKTILQCYDNMGPYFYVRTLSKNVKPNSKSGSPVIDKNGYLVGIVSGAEGKLGVIGSVAYLLDQLDQHTIAYDKHP